MRNDSQASEDCIVYPFCEESTVYEKIYFVLFDIKGSCHSFVVSFNCERMNKNSSRQRIGSLVHFALVIEHFNVMM
jgi:hypothetical protein